MLSCLFIFASFSFAFASLCSPGTYFKDLCIDCPVGFFCPGNDRFYQCPVGTYGIKTGLVNEKCSGKCGVGYVCDAGSVTPKICPAGFFCPDGSKSIMCPEGTFGSKSGLMTASCSGTCPVGYECPSGSIKPLKKLPKLFNTQQTPITTTFAISLGIIVTFAIWILVVQSRVEKVEETNCIV